MQKYCTVQLLASLWWGGCAARLDAVLILQVIKLRAVCACRREAAFTHRLGLEQDVEVRSCGKQHAMPAMHPGPQQPS